MKRRPVKGFVVYAVILIGVLILAEALSLFSAPATDKIGYNDLLSLVEQQRVAALSFTGNDVVGLYVDSSTARAEFPQRYDFSCTVDRDAFFSSARIIRAKQLGVSPDEVADADLGFTVQYQKPAATPWYVEFLPYVVVMVLMAFFWLAVMRSQSGGGNSKVMNFGKSRAHMADPSKNKVTFADVAGADEEKEELAEIVDFLKDPKRYTELGARIPKGVLLVGPPGTGKTLLAKAIAGEAGVPFFSISGSDFVEMFVGVGASRVRDLFEQAKKHAPAIVFIDEIDAVGRQRGAGLGGGHDEREQTLNQLLVEMDGFSNNEGVIVIAATNRRDILDPALLRPGRFDRQITVNYPDVAGREAILRVHCRNKKIAADVDLKTVARRTPFFTGADLENVLNEAAILTARAGREEIDQRTIMDAITRVEMGPEKRSRKVTAKDKRIVAYHEAGHALVGLKTPKADDVSMVTIVPRGSSGGHTQFLPSEESDFISREQILARITVAMGGRAAETLIIEDVTTGASADLQSATELARRMIAQFGMDEVIGPVYHGGNAEVFLGRDFAQSRDCSEKVAAQIDEEIRKVASSCQQKAIDILKENMDKLHRMADVLLERETITKPELDAIMKGEALPELPAQGAEEKAAQPEAKAEENEG